MAGICYSQLPARLDSLRDETYRRFNESLIPGAEGTSYGVRLPQLRVIAREILQGDWQRFLSEAKDSPIYEIIMLRGLVIATAPCEYSQRLHLLAGFVPSIQNWAVCDCVTGSLKSARRHLPETWTFLQPYLQSRKEFELRFAVVMLMDYFLTEEYIEQVLALLRCIRHEGYYVNMAIAWALSVCFVKFRNRTLALFQSKVLSPWVQNKAIQKCRESRRVTAEDKQLLLSYKLQAL